MPNDDEFTDEEMDGTIDNIWHKIYVNSKQYQFMHKVMHNI